MNIRLVFTIFILSIIISGCDEKKQYELVSATGALTKEEQELYQSVVGSELLRKVSLGSFDCYVPDDKPESMFFCTKGSQILFHRIAGNIQELVIPTNRNSSNILVLKDLDNDGEYDALSYDGSNESGELNRQLYDDNLDGNPDKFIDFSDPSLNIRIGDKWLQARSEGRDSSGKVLYEIVIEGKKKRIYPFSYPYKIESMESNK